MLRDGVIYYFTNSIIAVAGLALFGVYGQSALTAVPPLFIASTSSVVSSQFVLILKGDPSYATGVYRSGNELRIGSQDVKDLTVPEFDEEN